MSIYHAQTLLTVLDDHCILKSGRLLDKFCCIKFAARPKKKKFVLDLILFSMKIAKFNPNLIICFCLLAIEVQNQQ